MTDEKIIEKIKKLLALASSPNEEEAQRAMEQAQKLMARYSLSADEVLTNKAEREEIKTEVYDSEYFSKQGVLEAFPPIAAVITPIFGVYTIVQSRGRSIHAFELIGFPTNLKVARYALDSILAQGIAEARAQYKKFRTTSFGSSFWSGFAIGIHKKFGKFEKESQALVVYDPVRAYLESIKTGMFNSHLHDGVAKGIGIEAGQRAELRSGIGAGNTGKLIS